MGIYCGSFGQSVAVLFEVEPKTDNAVCQSKQKYNTQFAASVSHVEVIKRIHRAISASIPLQEILTKTDVSLLVLCYCSMWENLFFIIKNEIVFEVFHLVNRVQFVWSSNFEHTIRVCTFPINTAHSNWTLYGVVISREFWLQISLAIKRDQVDFCSLRTVGC